MMFPRYSVQLDVQMDCSYSLTTYSPCLDISRWQTKEKNKMKSKNTQTIFPSIHLSPLPASSCTHGQPVLAIRGWKQGTSWISHQVIATATLKGKQPFTLTHTLTIYSSQLASNDHDLKSVNRKEPSRHKKNIHSTQKRPKLNLLQYHCAISAILFYHIKEQYKMYIWAFVLTKTIVSMWEI